MEFAIDIHSDVMMIPHGYTRTGSTKLESTVRYLGIEVDDGLEIAEQTEV